MQMNDIIKIYLDAKPKELIPFEITDFNAKCVVNCMYEPLFYEYNGDYISDYITDESTNKELIWKCKTIFWSNGKKLTIHDIYKTITYIIQNKLPLAHYLEFIPGVNEFLNNEGLFENISISIQEDKIIIGLLQNSFINYKELFSNINFSPVYFEQDIPIISISNGRYSIIDHDSLMFKKNIYFNNNNFENIYLQFDICSSIEKNINDFKVGICNLTSTTLLPFDLLTNNISQLYHSKSNIQFYLEINEDLLSIKKDLWSYILDNISKSPTLRLGLYPIDAYISNNDFTVVCKQNHEKNFTGKTINILVSDYYPNMQIIAWINNYFIERQANVKVTKLEFNRYLQELHSKKYEIKLTLINPISNSILDKLIYYIPYFSEIHIDQYIDLVNNFIQDSNKLKEINDFLIYYATLFPICNGSHIYLKSNNLNKFYIDKNDNYKYRNL